MAEQPAAAKPPKAPAKAPAKAPDPKAVAGKAPVGKAPGKAPEAGPAAPTEKPVPAEPKLPPKRSYVAERIFASSPVRDDPTKAFTLVTDPRTGLPLIEIPKDKSKVFSDLGKDVLLHVFMDVDKVTSKGKFLRRVMFLTDQTLFLCEDSGGVARCFQISLITEIAVAADASNILALKVPSEYDLLLRFDKPEQLQNMVEALKLIFKRMTDQDLKVSAPKDVKHTAYKMSKPNGFVPTIVPQRTKAHLKKSLENMEKGETEKIKMIEAVQGELENEHKTQIGTMQKEVDTVLGKLDEMNRKMKESQEAYAKQQTELERVKKRVGEIDGQFGPSGEAPPNKDNKIREMQKMIDTLNQQLQTEQQQRNRLQQLQTLGNFAEVDVGETAGGAPAAPANLVQLLQDQLAARTKELDLIDSRQREIAVLQDQLRNGEGTPSNNTKSVTLPLPNSSIVSTPAPVPSGGGPQWNTSQLFDIYEQQQPHIPASESDLRADPYNGLYLVDIPPSMTTQFKDLCGCVMYMFALTQQMSKKSLPQNRCIVISDMTLFVCGMDGSIMRCIDLRSISEIAMDDAGHVGIRVAGKGEYDAFFRLQSLDVSNDLVAIIQAIHRQLNVQPRMSLVQFPQGKTLVPDETYRLEKPPDWVFQLHTVRSKVALLQKFNEERVKRDRERRSVEAAADAYAGDVIQSLRAEVRTEYESVVEQEFRQLQTKATGLEQSLGERMHEVAMLRSELARHKCYDPSGKPGNRNDVTAWVPTDPLVVDCGLPILCMHLHEDVLITSHSNGFVNVWNAVTGTLLKTLKDHTGRVTTLQYNGIDLYTGSHDTTIRRWNIDSGLCMGTLQPSHKGHVTALQFNAAILVSGSSDCTVKVWNLVTHKCDKVLRGHKNTVTAVSFENKTIVSAEWGWIFVWDSEFGVVTKALRDEMGGINSVAVYENKIVAGGNGCDLHVWDIHAGEFYPLDGHTDDVTKVAVVDNLLVSCSTDCTIRMWTMPDFKPLGIFHNSFPIEVKGFHLSKTQFAVAESKLVKVFSR